MLFFVFIALRGVEGCYFVCFYYNNTTKSQGCIAEKELKVLFKLQVWKTITFISFKIENWGRQTNYF